MAGMWFGGHGDGPPPFLFKESLLLSYRECYRQTFQLSVPSRIASAAESHLAQDQLLPKAGTSSDF